MSQEWVDVKAEAETAAPATNTQSWADDHPEQVPEVSQPRSSHSDHHVLISYFSLLLLLLMPMMVSTRSSETSPATSVRVAATVDEAEVNGEAAAASAVRVVVAEVVATVATVVTVVTVVTAVTAVPAVLLALAATRSRKALVGIPWVDSQPTILLASPGDECIP